jgi:hypothetical protein
MVQDPLQSLYVGSAGHLSSWLLVLVHDIWTNVGMRTGNRQRLAHMKMTAT